MRVIFFSLLVFLFSCACVEGKEDYSIILKRNIFTSHKIPKVEKKSILKVPLPPKLETLIERVGIIYFKEAPSYVIIREKRGQKENIYKKGEVVEGAEILGIEKDRVFFKYNGETIAMSLENKVEQTQYVSIDKNIKVGVKEEPKVLIPESEPPLTINFSEAINTLKNDKLLLKNVNIAPYVKKGKVEGFKVSRLPSSSLPYKYGLRNGDVIHRVNGILIDSLSKGFAVYNQIIKSGTKLVTVEILRNGRPVILTYRLQ